jgi:hypothetical protein
MFLLKNMDYQNVSCDSCPEDETDDSQAANARIMNKGTDQNILTQLHMTANEYNFVSTVYYVSPPPPRL